MSVESATALPISKEASAVEVRPSPWLWLAWPAAALVALVSLAGLVVPGIYHDPEAWRIQAIAQDFIDLVLVAPLLAVSAWLALRGSMRGRLVCLGTLSYVVYTFVIYAFAVQHNALFLAYVAALGCAFWALVLGLASTDWRAIGSRFEPGAPVRWVGLFLLVPAIVFYALWLADEVPATLSGVVPPSLVPLGIPTNPVHVLDLAVMLPAMALAGALAWRRRSFAYGLAEVLLVNVLLQNLAIATMMLVAYRAGQSDTPGPIGLFVLLAAVGLAVQIAFMRRMRVQAR